MAELLLQYSDDGRIYELTSWQSMFTGNCIMMLSDSTGGSEINFYKQQASNLLELLCRLSIATGQGVDFATSEEYDEELDEYTGYYYWDDILLDDRKINPYFGPEDGVYGTWCSSEAINVFIDMLREYLNDDVDDMNNLEKYGIRRLITIHNEVVYGQI